MKAIISHAFAPGTPPFRTAIINISRGVAAVSASDMAAIESSIRTMIPASTQMEIPIRTANASSSS